MPRRHFLQHAAAAATIVPTLQFIDHVQANAATLKKKNKSCILMWMGGGPPTIDIWDLKPTSKNGGEFKPIGTAGDLQISEHMPMTAQVMDNLSVVRSMSTREADHTRGRYFMTTSFVPNPTVTHASFGSVVSFELGRERKELEIPAYIAIGSGGMGSGYLGMRHAPFSVTPTGQIRNADLGGLDQKRLQNRLKMWESIESKFMNSGRGDLPTAHRDVYKSAVNLMVSDQMKAFKVDEEPPEMIERYGGNNFGRSLLMARRLVETGVPFVEVNLGGWDLHAGVFDALRTNQLPVLDRGLASLTADLKDRGLLDDTVLVWMGEFGRTPRINQNGGRDHWAHAWSVMVGGGGLQGGIAVGETNPEGTAVEGKAYVPGDIWASVAQALGIPTTTVHTSKRGRPMKLANSGQPIKELVDALPGGGKLASS
ncbi:MAG: DUF1501 domain-containing protein [Planctomycetes bacterium]|nr:DUF1501 domain-containing protein [Planctomycetota bacterium]